MFPSVVVGWRFVILTANMETFGRILWITTNVYHFTISPRSSVTNIKVIFFMSVIPLFLHNVSANTKHFLFSFIYQNYKMYMCKYYTACTVNHKYYSTDMLNITNTIHKPLGQWNVHFNPHSYGTIYKSKLCLVTVEFIQILLVYTFHKYNNLIYSGRGDRKTKKLLYLQKTIKFSVSQFFHIFKSIQPIST